MAPAASWLMFRPAKDDLPTTVPASRARRPNVLLIVLDTVRADHLSCYGYPRPTTPHIDAFAETARRFTQAVSPAPWTLPSHASFFTGLPTTAHGATMANQMLAPHFPTLAEQLGATGYQTLGLSCNRAWVTGREGLDRGFDQFWVSPREPVTLASILLERFGHRREYVEDNTASAAMHRRLGNWFRKDYQPDKPFFIFMNYIDAHGPYIPPLDNLKWADRAMVGRWTKQT
ncbi:MAG: sulfatase-like hydrolase/transferase, partial [Planctomycetota bacterium]